MNLVKKLNLRLSSANWSAFLRDSWDCPLDRRRRIPRKRDSFAEWRDPENVPGAMPAQGILPKDRPQLTAPGLRLLRRGRERAVALSPVPELQ